MGVRHDTRGDKEIVSDSSAPERSKPKDVLNVELMHDAVDRILVWRVVRIDQTIRIAVEGLRSLSLLI